MTRSTWAKRCSAMAGSKKKAASVKPKPRLKPTVIEARLTENVPGFDTADFSLKPIQLAVVAGLIFINLDPGATPEDGDLA